MMIALALIAAVAAPGPITVDRVESYRGDRTQTRLVARDGPRRFVLARADMGRRTGTLLGGFWASGRSVVYVKSRYGRRWTVVRLRVVRVGRRVRRLETLRLYRVRRGAYAPDDAVITSRGALAWVTPEGVVVRRPGGRPRLVMRGSFDTLDLEDDRTLRIDRARFFDLRPAPEPRCGDRERFRPVFTSADVVVTRAIYGGPDVETAVVRACRRADGRDPVVAAGDWIFPEAGALDVAGADRDWVVLSTYSCWRGAGCGGAVRAVQAGTGRRGGAAFVSGYELWLPTGELAVSEDGVPAWVSESAGVARLIAAPGQVLDTGAAGSIRDLEATGRTLTWTHDGEPRSAELSPG